VANKGLAGECLIRVASNRLKVTYFEGVRGGSVRMANKGLTGTGFAQKRGKWGFFEWKEPQIEASARVGALSGGIEGDG